jgi:hypothetical protein
MRIEVLYFDGCPHYETFLPHLRELIAASGVEADVELVHVRDAEAAEQKRFLGSPTVRVDGHDVEPGADQRTDFGLKCRLFRTAEGLSGAPSDEWLLAALARDA